MVFVHDTTAFGAVFVQLMALFNAVRRQLINYVLFRSFVPGFPIQALEVFPPKFLPRYWERIFGTFTDVCSVLCCTGAFNTVKCVRAKLLL